ncbi:MAG TPA: alpha-galactosidase [Caulobacteraceae bacterium]|nr:alpha-galactosidase [Caulobacteraceae bacterium]
MSRFLRLDGGGQTLLLQTAAGPPRLAYWGERLPDAFDEPGLAALAERATPHGMLDGGEALDLFPEAGRGFTGHPALECHRDDGSFVTQLAFVDSAEILGGVEVRLADLAAGVEVALIVEMDAETGVAAFRARVRNTGTTPLHLDWVAAAALPSPDDEVLLFDGRWAREFRTLRQRVETGLLVKDNRTGRTSHHSPPFMVLGEPGFGEHHGGVLGVHFAWSGDHRLLIERLRDGRVQVQAGELFWPGEMTLAAGEAYETPRLYAALSAAGLNGLSARFHPFVRHAVLGDRLTDKPRPVNFNTWEAVYFRHDLTELKALADAAAAVGAERYVLDDGWFKGRPTDASGLGDWTADPAKYPDGLGPLIDHVRGLGLEFGLWVEPEMANADSDLLRAHPDWILGVAGRDQPLGRGQYVLDLTRPEVAAHIFAQIDALLAAHPIGYLKWDMNRDLTHPASGGRPASHNQTRAVYALIDRLRAAHPAVEIESCASGGGRADYEILRRTDRIWTSDCNDPIERQSIQRGFSIFFPPEVMGAHVAAAVNHTTGRRTSLDMRALTALFGHLGVEADVRAFADAERMALQAWIEVYKTHRELIHHGQVVRQETADPHAVATMAVGEAGALASYAQLDTAAYATSDPFRIKGLDPDALYRVRLLNPARAGMKAAPALASGAPIEASGQLIETMGLPLPILRAGQIAVFHLERVTGAFAASRTTRPDPQGLERRDGR